MDQFNALVLLILFGVLAFIILFYLIPIKPWIVATFSGVRISLIELVFMRVRKVPVTELVNSVITLTKAGVPSDIMDLETFYLAGGNLREIVEWSIKAKSAGKNIKFSEISALLLADRDINVLIVKNDKNRQELRDLINHKLTDSEVKGLLDVARRYLDK